MVMTREEVEEVIADLDRRSESAALLAFSTGDDAQRARCRGKCMSFNHAAILLHDALIRSERNREECA